MGLAKFSRLLVMLCLILVLMSGVYGFVLTGPQPLLSWFGGGTSPDESSSSSSSTSSAPPAPSSPAPFEGPIPEAGTQVRLTTNGGDQVNLLSADGSGNSLPHFLTGTQDSQYTDDDRGVLVPHASGAEYRLRPIDNDEFGTLYELVLASPPPEPDVPEPEGGLSLEEAAAPEPETTEEDGGHQLLPERGALPDPVGGIEPDLSPDEIVQGYQDSGAANFEEYLQSNGYAYQPNPDGSFTVNGKLYSAEGDLLGDAPEVPNLPTTPVPVQPENPGASIPAPTTAPQSSSTFAFFNANGEPTNAAVRGGTVRLMAGPIQTGQHQILGQYHVAYADANEAILTDNPESTSGVLIRENNFLGGFTAYQAVKDDKGKWKRGAEIENSQLIAALQRTQRNTDIQAYQQARDTENCNGVADAIITNCGWSYDLSIMSTFATGADSLSGLFMSDESLAAWRNNVDEVFSYLEPSGWAAALCQEKIDSPPQGTAYVQLPGGQGAAVAATIAADCGKQTSLIDGNTTYLYKFVGFVKNPQVGLEETSLTFRLSVSGPSGSAELLSDGSRTLKPGESFSFQNRQAFVQFSENQYDQICVHFQNPPEFYTSNTVCNVIECTEVGSTGYEVPPEITEATTTTSTATGGAQTSSSSGTIWRTI